MVAYMRYYHEIFHVSHFTVPQLVARIGAEGRERLDAVVARGRNPVLALAHMGNWDMAGAWATREIGAVTTVAERLKPPELFDQFVAMRATIGLTIVPSDPGKVFRPLAEAAMSHERGIVPILADRDLSRRGIEVTMFGHAARVAAGPAALACHADVPLIPLAIVSEKLTGARRRVARSRHGYTLVVLPEVPRRPDLPAAQEVQVMTQGWATALAGVIAEHPTDWHMLQKVFVEDLDADKDAQVRGTDA
jgi:KDO2-lipid IV(A) lauroyltransferase